VRQTNEERREQLFEKQKGTGGAALSAGSQIDYLGTVRLRAGYACPNDFLMYATGGFAYGGVKSRFNIDVGSGMSSLFSAADSKSTSRTGWTVGAGAEYPVTDRVTFKAEYLYADLGKHTLIDTPFAVLGGTGNINVGVKTTAHIVRVGFNYALD
jgi:outer membrane immunogenic protein